jgi:DNA end-binding protein Ku
MFFADEVRNPTQEIGRLPDNASARSKEVDMAVSLIESMTSEWNPDNYRDTYTDRVQQLIEAKKTDQEIVIEPETEGSAQVLDLMQALRASVERARRDSAGNGDSTRGEATPTSGSGS